MNVIPFWILARFSEDDLYDYLREMCDGFQTRSGVELGNLNFGKNNRSFAVMW
jgi:hypothetical protein